MHIGGAAAPQRGQELGGLREQRSVCPLKRPVLTAQNLMSPASAAV